MRKKLYIIRHVVNGKTRTATVYATNLMAAQFNAVNRFDAVSSVALCVPIEYEPEIAFDVHPLILARN